MYLGVQKDCHEYGWMYGLLIDGDELDYGVYDIESRQEAQTAALKKADEIMNERLSDNNN